MKHATTIATAVMTAILILGQACAMRNDGPFILTEGNTPSHRLNGVDHYQLEVDEPSLVTIRSRGMNSGGRLIVAGEPSSVMVGMQMSH